MWVTRGKGEREREKGERDRVGWGDTGKRD